ncbi:MAG: methionyl-tRNA formyltransferase [Candidatus Zambryskibacteria bacterium]|nr:methionyl-tRNA formyltransferase [Candidatus Zambryskibacteria bacterium]
MKKIIWAFFGTSNFSVIILDELKTNGFIPTLIITTEDKPKGRKLILTPPEVKIWAEKEKVPYIQPKTLKNPDVVEIINKYAPKGFDVFVVASYGKIIPQSILDIPKYQTLNVHPSLLPKLRGASPIQNAILGESETGVTIMRLDAEMDHGPILAQEKIVLTEWPPYAEDLEKLLGKKGGKLLVETLSEWVDGKIKEQEQEHNLATYCQKIQKTDGELNLNDNVEINLRKIRAYHIWPGAYFFDDNKKRIVVKKAHIENDGLILDRIVPEGKKEMGYKDYLNGKKR